VAATIRYCTCVTGRVAPVLDSSFQLAPAENVRLNVSIAAPIRYSSACVVVGVLPEDPLVAFPVALAC
jgi:hypothetical protein